VAKTWAPRGRTPILRHCFNWPKLSAISAISRRGRLYFRLHRGTIRFPQVLEFLRQLLRHTRRPLFLLWDGAKPHRAVAVRRFVAQHRRLHIFPLPPYCPDLNPAEWFWAHLKCRQLASLAPSDGEELEHEIRLAVRRTRHRPDLIRSFFIASGLVRYL